MIWTARASDILDIPADVLVCSANPHLNLSGGVGGAFAMRFGYAMQDWLHAHLASLGRAHMQPGDCVVAPPLGSPYTAVIHVVGVDAAYRSSPPVVRAGIEAALAAAAASGARRVALAAIATGYGPLSVRDFAELTAPLLTRLFPPVQAVTVGVRDVDEAAEINAVWASLQSHEKPG